MQRPSSEPSASASACARSMSAKPGRQPPGHHQAHAAQRVEERRAPQANLDAGVEIALREQWLRFGEMDERLARPPRPERGLGAVDGDAEPHRRIVDVARQGARLAQAGLRRGAPAAQHLVVGKRGQQLHERVAAAAALGEGAGRGEDGVALLQLEVGGVAEAQQILGGTQRGARHLVALRRRREQRQRLRRKRSIASRCRCRPARGRRGDASAPPPTTAPAVSQW